MKPFSTAIIAVIALGLGALQAHAETCAQQITALESALRDAGGPVATDPGLTGQQSIGAQLHHQPTPSSIERAREQAAAEADDVISKARDLDAKGHHAECMRAVNDARVRFGID